MMEMWKDIFGNDVLSLIRRINATHLESDADLLKVNQE